ncbi:MAG: hypothetical protein Ct9H90mP20_2440 [Candidatus Neomarinimicrobiota bacterium]|nr:MAG: hypothetical protein Ct9H90mP20_2440 [Candidatus Neomarinimicrobiota bacterium]
MKWHMSRCNSASCKHSFFKCTIYSRRDSRTQNLRWKIWNDTDSSRCGTLFEHDIPNPKNIINDYENGFNQENVFL